MVNRIAAPIGAGFASALLFVVTAKGTAVAMALAYLTPLPIMIAALGWGFAGAAIACALACACVAATLEPMSGLLFGVTFALPAWGLAAAATLPRALLPWRGAQSGSPWLSVGAIVALAAAVGALISAGALVALIVVHGGYESGMGAFADALEPAIAEALGDASLVPDSESASALAASIVRLSPAAIAGSMMLMFCVNLYAAARSTALSHRLVRPWPDLPTELVLPPTLAVVALVALVLAFPLPAPASQFAWIVAAALGAAFALQGLAVLHALSRGLPLRRWLLAALYICCGARSSWTLPAVAILGLIESFVSLRARAAASKSKV